MGRMLNEIRNNEGTGDSWEERGQRSLVRGLWKAVEDIYQNLPAEMHGGCDDAQLTPNAELELL